MIVPVFLHQMGQKTELWQKSGVIDGKAAFVWFAWTVFHFLDFVFYGKHFGEFGKQNGSHMVRRGQKTVFWAVYTRKNRTGSGFYGENMLQYERLLSIFRFLFFIENILADLENAWPLGAA